LRFSNGSVLRFLKEVDHNIDGTSYRAGTRLNHISSSIGNHATSVQEFIDCFAESPDVSANICITSAPRRRFFGATGIHGTRWGESVFLCNSFTIPTEIAGHR
jgi:hypothetical protein